MPGDALNRSVSGLSVTPISVLHAFSQLTETPMTRLLYDIEDYLDDAAETGGLPRWMRRLVRSLGRTAGETGDLIARHLGRI